MAAFSTLIGAAGVGLAAAGTATQFIGMARAAKGEKRAEKLREAQMNLESQREKRSIVRQANIARAAALTSAESQGAQAGSGLAGGLGQITAQAGSAATAVNQNQQLGTGMFAANRMISSGNTMASIGSGLSSLGGSLFQNNDKLGRLGSYGFGLAN